MNSLDALILVAAALFAYSGYRQGFIVGVLSLLGFLGGGALGLVVVPAITADRGPGPGRSLLSIALVLVAAAVGQLVLGAVGQLLRRLVTWAPARAVDAGVGAVMSVVSLMLVSWFFASALRPGPVPALSRQISDSAVVTAVDAVMPDAARTVFSSFRRVLDDNPLPPVFGDLQPERIRAVAPPPREVALSAPIRSAMRSIVEVRGTASRCDRRVKGTGFVFAPQHVMTNAHVVAGVTRPSLTVAGTGRTYAARVVHYDAGRDAAVLFVPSLRTAPLRFERGAGRGDEAVVAGFPQGGPFQLEAARIREMITARGPDIYHSRQVNRQVFSLYADVEPGNSGGPLLSLRGTVYGVVFAKSLDDARTGYALTAEEVAPVVARGQAATKAVSTGACA